MARSGLAQIRHNHYVHDQACPTRKVLSSLAFTSLRVVLLPRKTGPLPLSVDILYEITSKSDINLSSLRLVWPRSLSNFLKLINFLAKEDTIEEAAYQQVLDNQVIHVDPNWASPIILLCGVIFVLLAQTPDAIITP
jgi:hypothetical protein